MLNRTNRTLSAHLNRLNLGTRTLASQASFNNGDSTLHTRLVHPVAVRAGVVGVPVYPMIMGPIGIPSIPGSPSVSPWLIASAAIHPMVAYATQLTSTADWQARMLDVPCRRLREPGLRFTGLAAQRGQAERQPFTGQRRQVVSRVALAVPGFKKPATLGPVAAKAAAAGG